MYNYLPAKISQWSVSSTVMYWI